MDFDTDVTARLRVLDDYAILDTPPEPAFDDIVAVIKEVCGVPVALVSFVIDDRQWFKARVGLDIDETPLNQSVCVHAIAHGTTLVIPDLRLDSRTAANPLVTGAPFIRFYAGALLRAPTGEDLGTLCVIDTSPRPEGLTQSQLAALEALARHVVQLMELRRLIAARDSALDGERHSRRTIEQRVNRIESETEEVREQRSRALAAQKAGRIGTFEAVVATGECRCSDEMCRIFGLPEATEYPASTFEKLIVPDDRARSSNARTRRDGSASTFTEYRIRRASDGALRWLTRRGDYIRDEAGTVVTFTGTVHDITDRKLAELRQAAMIRLGDEVRDAGSIDEIVRSATRILGETLDLSRAGYARIDVAANLLVTDVDWTSAGAPSGRGGHSLTGIAETIAELKRGLPLVVRDTAATGWLSLDLPAYAEYRIRAHVSIPFLAGGKLVGTLYAHSDVPRDWTVDEITFVRAVADRAYSAIARLESEERQHGLNAELSHRMKNTLSLVQAIATRTLRDVVDRTALDGFQDRIVALSKAHDVLLQQDWKSGRIRELVDSVLSLHVERMRLEVSGPNILIGSRAVLSLSLLLHELATNAVKHGSLSSESGRVAVNWKVDSASAHASLVLTWDETGGPPAAQPARLGLGSRLIKAGLAGTGGSLVRYDSTGFKAEFRATLAQLSEI